MMEELKEIYFDIQNKNLLLDSMNLEAFNIGGEVINNIFQTIENEMIMDTFLSKTEEVIPFKGGLPKTPLIVGLAGVLPDSINNLVSKFVGYQSKSAKHLTEFIENTRDEFDDIDYRIRGITCESEFLFNVLEFQFLLACTLKIVIKVPNLIS